MPTLTRSLTRAGTQALGKGGAPGLLGAGLTTLARTLGSEERHPLAPAAVRVERSRVRQGDASGDQVAVTLWFGQGPALPSMSPRPHPAARTAVRLGSAVVMAAALAAATTVASRLSEAQPRKQVLEGEARSV